MSDRVFRPRGQGLPGAMSVRPADLSDGDLPVWNSTTRKWDSVARTDMVQAEEDVWIVKTVNEVVANSATLQDDDALIYTIPSNGTWAFEVRLSIRNTQAAPDFKFAFAYTGTSTAGEYSWVSGDAVGTLDSSNTTSLTATSVVMTAASTNNVALVSGFITTSAVGDFKLQWAQNTATATNTNLRPGSWLKMRKV